MLRMGSYKCNDYFHFSFKEATNVVSQVVSLIESKNTITT